MYVYAYYDVNKEMVYVGSTRHVLNRFQQHKQDDLWMEQVDSVAVWGPYEDCEGLLCEKVLIAKKRPKFNTNMAYDFYDHDAPILHQGKIEFDNYEEMKRYFHSQPTEPKRCTFYLPVEDYEALRSLGHYCGERISKMTEELLHKAILEKAAEIRRPDLYDEVRKRLAKNAG